MQLQYLLSLLIFLSLSGNALLAQDFLIKSELREDSKTYRTHTLFDYDSTGYYVLRFDKSFGYAELEHYSPDLQLNNTFVVTKKYRKYIGVVNISNKLYLLYFRYIENKRENIHEKVSLYAKQLNPETYELMADSIELIEPFKMVSNYYRGNFAVSPDRSKILVYDYEEDGDIEGVSGLTNEVNLRVFDSSFNLLWKRSVNLSPTGSSKRMVAIKKLRVNNQGKVAILTDVFREHRSYSLRKTTADPTLFFVGQQKNDYAMFTPNLGDFFFNQINFIFDEVGNIVWFGFYSRQKYYQQSGFFYIKINKEVSKVLVKKMHDFTPEQIATLLNRKKISRNAEARSYKLVHWRLTKSGALILSAEQQPATNFNFKSHDVLVMQVSNEGEIEWFNHYYKYGEEPRRAKVFLSHYLCTVGDNTYLLFNNGLYSDGFATAVKIDGNGNSVSRKFYTYEKQQELLCPLLSFKLNRPEVFLCFQDRYFSAYRFAILDLEKMFTQ